MPAPETKADFAGEVQPRHINRNTCPHRTPVSQTARKQSRSFPLSLFPFSTFPLIRFWWPSARTFGFCASLLCLFLSAPPATQAGNAPAPREWIVDGVLRQSLVYAPSTAKTNPTPVIFAFHGHGGTMNNAARIFAFHTLWPEALVVYPQGLNTPGRLTDPEGRRPGWQHSVGSQGDRDLKFFDAMLATLKQEYRVDEKRLYAAGHSNGGAFTYLLWAARGDHFAAFAPSGAPAGPVLMLKPKPVLHVAGEEDQLVYFARQKRTIDALQRLNECGEAQPRGKYCTNYPSKIGAPVLTFIHPGGHQFPAEASPLIVKFFKEHAKD